MYVLNTCLNFTWVNYVYDVIIIITIIIIIKSFYSTLQKMHYKLMKAQNKIISSDGVMATGANSQEKKLFNYLIILLFVAI